MADRQHQRTYNVKAVVQETGLTADTLRAWERRYGVPQPGRTSGGQRVYSQDDVDQLKWLAGQLRLGVTISRAIDRWRARATELPVGSSSTALAVPAQPTPTALREEWLDACLAFDESRAEAVLLRAFNTLPADVVCQEVLNAGINQVGEAWFAGSVSVPQEHFTTELATRQIERLIANAPAPWRNHRLLVGCPEGETHAFGPLLFSLFLRWRGWDVVFLGADTPLGPWPDVVARIKPALVILGAQRLATAASLLDLARPTRPLGAPLAFGGRAFTVYPSLVSKVPGVYLGEELTRASGTVEQVTAGQLEPPPPQPIPAVFVRARQHLRERLPFLETELAQLVAAQPALDPGYVAVANRFLGEAILAALAFGDLSLLSRELGWTTALLTNHGLPAVALHGYLRAYLGAASAVLGEPGQPVIAWLRAYVEAAAPRQPERNLE